MIYGEKMKLLRILALSVFSLVPTLTQINAQEISPEQKEKIITNLANYDSVGTINSPWSSVRAISKYKIIEAIPALIHHLWKQKPEIQFEFLRTLQKLGSDQAGSLTLSFIDSLDHYDFDIHDIWVLYYKAAANDILFRIGDYTKRDYLYEMLDKNRSSIEWLATALLPLVLENIPEDEQKVKNELIKIANESSNENNRYFAMMSLYRKYGEEMLLLAKQRFMQETESSSRLVYLWEILSNYKNSEMHSFLINQTVADTSDYVKSEMFTNLLVNYGSPYDYKYVLQNKVNLPSPFINSCNVRLRLFKTVKPDNATHVTVLVDSLLSYHSQCFSFNWLGKIDFSSKLQNILADAKTKLSFGDSSGTALSIKQYQSLISNAYADSLGGDSNYVTKDGYRFLFYYPQYILDRLPKIPWINNITPELTVKKAGDFILSIYGDNFNNSSVILWNDSPRTTTYVSETLIQTNIGRKEIDREGLYAVSVKNNNGGISNQAGFEVVNKLVQPVIPLLDCVKHNADGTLTARLGYENKNGRAVLLPVGEENKIDSAKHDRSQPEMFMPGKHPNIFEITFDGKKLMWKLNNEKLTVDKNSPRCK
jgi:hypothetical protein